MNETQIELICLIKGKATKWFNMPTEQEYYEQHRKQGWITIDEDFEKTQRQKTYEKIEQLRQERTQTTINTEEMKIQEEYIE